MGFSSLEKILVLKTVSVFSETPDDVLVDIANLLEPVRLEAQQMVFAKGDTGDSMYIIVEGRVLVHDGDMTINYLGERAVFGEMAVLDPEPRSASVTAVEPVLLFRLDQRALYWLMERRIEVVRGVIHVLCQHLRARMRDLREDFAYMQQFAHLTAAAAAVERGTFEPQSLDDVARRTDELGQLARVFQRMAREVHEREQQLRQQVSDLRQEIDMVRQHVPAASPARFFEGLRQAAGMSKPSNPPEPPEPPE